MTPQEDSSRLLRLHVVYCDAAAVWSARSVLWALYMNAFSVALQIWSSLIFFSGRRIDYSIPSKEHSSLGDREVRVQALGSQNNPLTISSLQAPMSYHSSYTSPPT